MGKIKSPEELRYLIDGLCKTYFEGKKEFSYKAIVSIMDTLDGVKNRYIKSLVRGYIESLKDKGDI